MKYFLNRLSSRLFMAFAALAISVVVGLSFFSIRLRAVEIRAEILHTTQSIARSLSHEVQDYLSTAEEVLMVVAQDDYLAERELDDLRIRLELERFLRVNDNIQELHVHKGSGEFLWGVSMVRPSSDLGHDEKLLSSLSDIIKGKKSNWYVGLGTTTNRPLEITIAVPIEEIPGKTIRYLMGILDYRPIWDIIEGARIGKKGTAFLVDSEGRVLAHKKRIYSIKHRDLSSLPSVKAVGQGRSGYYVYSNNEGIGVAAAADVIENLGLGVIVQIPTEEAFAPIGVMVRQTLWMALVACLLSLALAWFLARILVVSIMSVVRASREFAEGHLEKKVEVKTNIREIVHLGNAFNTMARSLEKVINERKRTEDQLQKQTQQLAILSEINQAITSTLDPHSVLDSLLEKIDRLLPYPVTNIRLLNKETGDLEVVACRNVAVREWRKNKLTGTSPFAKLVIEKKVAMAVDNMQTDPQILYPEFCRKHGLVSCLGVPLIAKGKALGTLSFYTRHEHPFSNEESDFLTIMGGQAATAIHNSQLFEQVEQRTREISSLQTITATASKSLEVDTVLQEVILGITEIFGFDGTRIFLRTDQNDELRLQAYSKPELWSENTVFRRGEGINAKVAETGQPLIFENVQTDPQYRELAVSKSVQKTGYNFYAVFPIKSNQKFVGIINCWGRTPRRLTADEIRLLTSMANQVGIAIENAGLYQNTRKQAADLQKSLKEKEILLKEIHHRVKNNLQVVSSLFSLQSGVADDKPPKEVLQECRDRVRIMALAHEKLYQSKDLARIDFPDYIRAVATYLTQLHRATADGVTLKVNSVDVLLEIDKIIPCGLIVSELVANSLKYAFPACKPGEICIDIRSDDDNQLTLSVRDNGVGFPKEMDFRNSDSLGLQLVNTLTNQLEGTIELDSNGGTAFKIQFPNIKHMEMV